MACQLLAIGPFLLAFLSFTEPIDEVTDDQAISELERGLDRVIDAGA